MRKLTVCIIGAALALMLAGCAENHASVSDKRFGLDGSSISAKVISDQVTGVYWVIFQNGHGSIDAEPILLPDGTPQRVDNADYDDVKADIEANQIRWTEDYDEAQKEHDRATSSAQGGK